MARSAAFNAWIADAKRVDISDVVNKRSLKLSRTKSGFEGACPQCGGDDRFWVLAKKGKQHFGCRGCGKGGDVIALVQFLDGCDFVHAIEKLTGRPPPPKPDPKPKRDTKGKLGPVVATYNYTNESRELLHQVTRHDPKDFRQRRPDGNGGWINNIDGVRLVPYRLPELIAAVQGQRTIFVVEGEKDVAAAVALGLEATTSPGGVGMAWRDDYDRHFAGADVVVVPDQDHRGKAHSQNISNHLLKVARRVRWMELPAKDLTKYLEDGGTREALDQLISSAPDYQAEPLAESPAAGDAVDQEIERLAKLPIVQYERERKAAAEKLEVRAPILDKLVAAKRAELGLDASDGKQGHAIAFDEIQPWDAPVNGRELLDAIADVTGDYVVMSELARVRVTLWTLHAHLKNCFLFSPRLAIRSPTKRCGKTTLLDVIGHLVPRPLMAANVTPSVVFRVIEGHGPTLLIDEADTIIHKQDNDELRAILNAGHRRGGVVLRNVGDDHEPRAFNVFGPCVVALIGELPGTLADRSITVDLKRRLASETIEPLRLDRTERLDLLARQAARWCADHAEAVRTADPTMPNGIFNRDSDNWKSLLSIATIAGGSWPERARQAAVDGFQAKPKAPGLKCSWPIFKPSSRPRRMWNATRRPT
jgi:Protein of unknown function (DUF3631)/CHC2 zinc finger